MRVAVVGSRRYSEPTRVSDYVNALPPRASIITGSASGVDAAATKAARAKGIAVQVMPASFDELADASRAAARTHPAGERRRGGRGEPVGRAHPAAGRCVRRARRLLGWKLARHAGHGGAGAGLR